MKDCLFCKIVEGSIPTQKIYDGDQVLAFKDISPQAPVHYLFIPKEHYSSLADVPTDRVNIMASIFGAIKKVADQEGLSAKGYRTVINTGQDGGQVVFHLHVHLLAGKKMSGGLG
jgi:histidine triad (HIT) family protein